MKFLSWRPITVNDKKKIRNKTKEGIYWRPGETFRTPKYNANLFRIFSWTFDWIIVKHKLLLRVKAWAKAQTPYPTLILMTQIYLILIFIGCFALGRWFTYRIIMTLKRANATIISIYRIFDMLCHSRRDWRLPSLTI